MIAVACLVAGTATAAPKVTAPPPPKAWIGTFDPLVAKKPCTADCKLVPTPHAGVVVVLTPQTGDPASGDVVVVQPLLGAIASGHIESSRVSLAQFSYDLNRDGDDGVLILPAGTPAKILAVTKPEVAAIRATLMHDDALAGVKKALNDLEVATVDIDGDGKADFAVTYGCNGWADGVCQSRGQFFLASRGGRWVEIE